MPGASSRTLERVEVLHYKTNDYGVHRETKLGPIRVNRINNYSVRPRAVMYVWINSPLRKIFRKN